MKLNIEKEFVDKISGELHKVGDVIEVEKARGEELLADDRKLVSFNAADEEPPKQTRATKVTKKK